MTTQEQFEMLVQEHRIKYFKKYFIGKNIDEAMYVTTSKIVMELAALITEIRILLDCLCAIKKDKNYFIRLDYQYQRRVKSNIIGLKLMNKELNAILTPIYEGLINE